jgi:copper(I)-binding protein
MQKKSVRFVMAGLAVLFPTLHMLPHQVHAHEGLVHEGCAANQVFTAGDLEISGAFTRAMLPSAKTAGGYLVITNNGATVDRLVGGTTEAAAALQVHKMEMVGDVMKMGAVEGGIEIPAGGTVELAPGGFHLMLMGVQTPFVEGECVAVTLQFETAGAVPVMLSIGGMTADAAPAGGHHDGMSMEHDH